MTQPPALWERMRVLADQREKASGAHPDPAVDELRVKADKFEAAAKGFYGSPQTNTVQQFLGSFARARRLWCDLTGEPLV